MRQYIYELTIKENMQSIDTFMFKGNKLIINELPGNYILFYQPKDWSQL